MAVVTNIDSEHLDFHGSFENLEEAFNKLQEFKNNTLQEPNYLTEASKKWDRVFVEGKWDSSQQMLIDNVINRGIAGYKVLTPFRIAETEEVILIDRGWIKGNKSRDDLPNINMVETFEKVSGILKS